MGKSIAGAISYNERKVSAGTADLILATQFGRDIDTVDFSGKIQRFKKLNVLNNKSQTNTLHLSLNFAAGERLDTETMRQIAQDYMERIGFGDQPYLVYRHFDAAHPHIHIVTNTIKANGKAIYLHNLAKRKSEPARKQIEIDYCLVRAEDRRKQDLPLSIANVETIKYSQHETKRTISNIVLQVVGSYKYTSLDELNAVLRQYNIVADGGTVHSRMYQHRGLQYCFVDSTGNKTGIPIKASAIYGSPTLKLLEKKFSVNSLRKMAVRPKMLERVNRIVDGASSRNDLMERLRKNNIGCTVYSDKSGTITSISFIDHFSKTVFTSADLGISILELLARFDTKKPTTQLPRPSKGPKDFPEIHGTSHFLGTSTRIREGTVDLLTTLAQAEEHPAMLTDEFKKKKRKKKKP